MHFEPWQWALLIAGAFVVGLAKTGIAGLGILFVAVINLAIPARQATGVILPMLVRALTYRDRGLALTVEKALSGGTEGVLHMTTDSCGKDHGIRDGKR